MHCSTHALTSTTVQHVLHVQVAVDGNGELFWPIPDGNALLWLHEDDHSLLGAVLERTHNRAQQHQHHITRFVLPHCRGNT